MKAMKMLLIVTGVWALSSTASAAPLLFTLTGANTISFTVDSNPTVEVNVFNTISRFNVASIIDGKSYGLTTLYIKNGDPTYLIINSNYNPLYYFAFEGGDPFYVGSFDKPVFAPGTFKLTNVTSQGNFTLNITNPLAPVIPEPTTWAMMLVGFSMMGASMRYRRKSTAVSFA